MYVTIPNAENYQIHTSLFIAAWKVWFKRFSDSQNKWRQSQMPIHLSDAGLAALLDDDKRFSLEVICRLLVPWNYRNKPMADIAFLQMNPDLLRPVTITTEDGNDIDGVRLADRAIDHWEQLTFLEQDIFQTFAEARIQADVESTSSDPIIIDDGGLAIIGDDIYPPLVPEQGDGIDTYIKALVAWIDEDPFQPMYHRKPVGEPVSGWNNRLQVTFWPKPRSNYAMLNKLADPLLYRCRLLSARIFNGKEWNDRDKLRAVKTAQEIFMLFGLPQREFTAADVEDVFRAAIFQISDSKAKMNSGWSKVAAYATAFMEQHPEQTPHVSWNSRVSTAVISRLDFLMVEAGEDNPEKLFPNLGIISGWGGTRPRELSLEWPDAYRKWPYQIAASAFVKRIRDHVNTAIDENGDRLYAPMPHPDGGTRDWTIRGIQQVLSADGY